MTDEAAPRGAMAVLMLGSNALEPHRPVERAVEALRALDPTLIVAAPVQTEPWGDVPGPFVNQAVGLPRPPAAIREALRAVEARLGRVRGSEAGPRHIIDIDLVGWLPAGSGRDARAAIVRDLPLFAGPLLRDLFHRLDAAETKGPAGSS